VRGAARTAKFHSDRVWGLRGEFLFNLLEEMGLSSQLEELDRAAALPHPIAWFGPPLDCFAP
jgi:hypothetical protein